MAPLWGRRPPEACARALLAVLDDESLAGEVVAVHPAAPGGCGHAVVPADAPPFLGAWSAAKSDEVAGVVDDGLRAIGSGELSPAWSGV